MSTHNICFHGEIKKKIIWILLIRMLSLLSLLMIIQDGYCAINLSSTVLTLNIMLP